MFKARAYRHPSEIPILILTFLLSIAVVVATAFMTQCLSFLLVLLILGVAVYTTYVMQTQLIKNAALVSPEGSPELDKVVRLCAQRLQPGSLNVYVASEEAMNAYTFGFSNPKNVVLYEPLVRAMNPQELAFVLGHEMGHISLGHTWLYPLVGGLAGSRAPSLGMRYILYLIFLCWTRACEFSCDRAGLLACGSLDDAVSALVRLASPEIQTRADFEQALDKIDTQGGAFLNKLIELLRSHPNMMKRVNALKAYAASPEYTSLQAKVNSNL